MSIDLGTVLAVVGAVLSGNLYSWSIGGPSEKVSLGNLFSQPQGISHSHNKYEGDASATRGDLYLYGEASRLQLENFEALYNLVPPGPEAYFDFAVLTTHHANMVDRSIALNPYFFIGPFSGFGVANAEHAFMRGMFANHSEEHPDGFLNHEVLKSFYAITGDKELTYLAGHERIPENWYRRPIGKEYSNVNVALDLVTMIKMYPQLAKIGGNTGEVNTFTGVDLTDLTGGVFNAVNLLEGNNAACFFYEAVQVATPDILKGIVDFPYELSTVKSMIGKTTSKLGCPQMTKFNTSAFSQFPGYAKLRLDGTYQ